MCQRAVNTLWMSTDVCILTRARLQTTASPLKLWSRGYWGKLFYSSICYWPPTIVPLILHLGLQANTRVGNVEAPHRAYRKQTSLSIATFRRPASRKLEALREQQVDPRDFLPRPQYGRNHYYTFVLEINELSVINQNTAGKSLTTVNTDRMAGVRFHRRALRCFTFHHVRERSRFHTATTGTRSRGRADWCN